MYKASQNPIEVKRHEFSFKKLTECVRGVFILEFTGNGITSRAVIRKGGLSYIEQKTIAGHLLTLVQENNKVCIPDSSLGQKTGVWLQGRFLKVNDKGQVMVPYATQSYSS